MKILPITLLALFLFSCTEDSINEPTIESNLTLQTPNKDLANSNLGLYHGIVATYDQAVHGEIIISVKNDGTLRAYAMLLDGSEMRFRGTELATNSFIFKGDRGIFSFDLDDSKQIKIENASFDEKPGALIAYRERPGGGGVSIAFGSYVDSSDPTFNGVWDFINTGLIEGSAGGSVIEDIAITHTGGLLFTDLDAGIYEAFTPCILFPATQPYVSLSPVPGGNSFINAKEQQSRFNGSVCDWTVQYATNSTTSVYFDNVSCNPDPAGSGSWSWRGRNGTITVISPVGLLGNN